MLVEFAIESGRAGVRLDLIEKVIDAAQPHEKWASTVLCEDGEHWRSTEPAADIIARINAAYERQRTVHAPDFMDLIRRGI